MLSLNLKKRFGLIFFCMVLLIGSIAIIMSIGIRNTSVHIQDAVGVDELIVKLYELRILNDEYIETPSDRVTQQWRTKFEQIKTKIKQQNNIPEEVSDALDGMEKLFTDLSTQLKAQGEDATQKVMRTQTATNLNLESQRIIDWATDISRQTKDNIVPKLKRTISITFAVMLAITLATMTIMFITTRHILSSIIRLKDGADEIASGRVGFQVEQAGNDEIALLAVSINRMSNNLLESQSGMEDRIRLATEDLRGRDRFKSAQNDLNMVMRGDKNSAELADDVLDFLICYLGAVAGVFYLYDDKDEYLEIIAMYAVSGGKRLHERILPGEGLAGQAALERKIIRLDKVPRNYLTVGSALGEAEPLNIILLPLINNNNLLGVMEIGSFKSFGSSDLEFLEQTTEGISIALSVNKSRQMLNRLLEQTELH